MNTQNITTVNVDMWTTGNMPAVRKAIAADAAAIKRGDLDLTDETVESRIAAFDTRIDDSIVDNPFDRVTARAAAALIELVADAKARAAQDALMRAHHNAVAASCREIQRELSA